MKKKSLYFSISQAAKELNVSQETLRRWEKAGKITTVRLDGKNRYFAKKDIEKIKGEMPLSISEVSKQLGISVHTIRRLVDNGVLNSQRNERHERVFSLKEIEQYQAKILDTKKREMYTSHVPHSKPPSTILFSSKATTAQEPISIPVYSPLDMASITVHDIRTFPVSKPLADETPQEPTFSEIITTTQQQKTTQSDSFTTKKITGYFPLNKIRAIITIASAVFLLTFLPLVAAMRLNHPSLPVEASEGRQVLAASTKQLLGTLAINLPVTFTNDVNFQGNLTAGSLSLFKNGLTVQEGNIQVTDGSITAPNLIYSVTGGNGVTVTGGQNPVISFSGVTSIGGQTGAIKIAAGDGITVDGTKITNNDKGSSQNIFKHVVVGSDTITAGSNDDSLTFVAGTGITLTPDTDTKQLTIASVGGGGGSSQWTTKASDIFYALGNVGIGTSNPSYRLHVVGNANITGTLNVGSTLAVSGTITGTTLNGTTGINTGAGAGTLRIDSSGNLSNIGTTQLNGLTYTWPGAGGSSNYVLTTNGSGTLTWKAISGAGGAGAGTITAIGDVSSGDAFTSGGTTGTSLYFADSGFHGQLAVGTLTSDQTYTLPNESGTLCLTSGNCAGSGGGITGSGTTNFLSKFNTSGTLTSSSIFDNGNIGIGTSTPSDFALQVAGTIGPDATDTYDLGSSSKEFNNIYGKNIYASGDLVVTGNISSTGGSVGFWQRKDGAIAPADIADDLIIGGTATSSALVQFSGTPVTTGTGAKFNFNDLTSGTGVDISSNPTNSTSGNLLALAQNGTFASTGTAISSNLLNISRSLTSQTIQNNPVFDASSHGARVYTQAPMSWSHTVGSNDNRLLIVYVSGFYSGFAPQLPTGATYNGIAMTLLKTKIFDGNQTFMYVYYLLNPPSGTHTIAISSGTASNNAQVGGAISWYNVDQTSPFGTIVTASGSSTNPSATVSTTSTQVVVDALGKDGGYPYTQSISAGSGQTTYWTDTGSFGYDGGGMSSKSVTGANTTMSWTLSPSMPWGLIAIPVNSTPTGNPLAISGDLASLTSNCDAATGFACNDTSNILSLNQEFDQSAGDVLSVSGSGKGNLATFDTTNTSANGLSVDLASSSSDQYALKLTGNNGGTAILYAGANGNVGAGTTSPSTNFEVASNVTGSLGTTLRVTGGGGANTAVALDLAPYEPTIGNAPGFRIMATDDGNYSTNIAFQLKTPGGMTNSLSTKLALTSAGNLGIGTTSPTALLNIYNPTTDAIGLSQSGSATNYAMFSTKGTGRTYNFGVGGGSETNFGVANKFFVFDATAGAMRMIIDTNGNIGIGTANPSSLFSVGSSSQFQVNGSGQLYLADGTAPGTTTNILYANGGNLYWNGTLLNGAGGGGGGTSQWTTTTNDIYYSLGNVGIGTNSPKGLLNISGAPTGKALTILNETGDQDILTASSSGTTKFTLNNNGQLYLADGTAPGTTTNILYANSGNLYWNGTQLNGVGGGGSSQWTTTGSNISYSAGNVGIGITNPNHTFTINTTVAGNALVGIENNSLTGYSGIHFYDSSNIIAGHIGYANASTGNYLAGKFYAGSTQAKDFVLTTNDTARMTITSGGNIGIGTTNPLATLDVNGVAHILGSTTPSYPTGGQGLELAFDTDGKAGGVSGGSGTTLLQSYNRGTSAWNDLWVGAMNTEFDANGVAAMYINSSGNIGIGTTNPQRMLHISSATSANLEIEADTGNSNEAYTPYIMFKQDGGATTGYLGFEGNNGQNFTNSLANALYMNAAGPNPIQLSTNNTARVTIDPNGNVGIGTSAPEFPLDMNNGTVGNANEYTINDTGQGEGYCFLNTSQCMSIYTVGQGGYNAYVFDTISGYPYVFNNGNVGIGVTNPTSAFSLKDSQAGGGHNSAMFDMTSAGVNYTVALGTNTTRASFGTTSNSDFALGTNNTFDRLYLAKDGNVGIGTTSPTTAKLNVSGTGYISGNVGIGTTNLGAGLNVGGGSPSGANRVIIKGISDDDTLALENYNTTKKWAMTVYGNDFRLGETGVAYWLNVQAATGNVGIGTTSPNAKLQVDGGTGNGGIRINGATGSTAYLDFAVNNTLKGNFYWDTTNNFFGINSMSTNTVLNPVGGNVGIGVLNPLNPFQVGTNNTNGNGAYVSAGGAWTNGSSITFKSDFQTLNQQDILSKIASLPIDEWSYNLEGDGVRHIGPFAEDFYAAFGVGNDNKHISTIDPAGVALVGIQALNSNLNSLQTTVDGLSGTNGNNTSLTDTINSLTNNTSTNTKAIASLSASLNSVKEQLSTLDNLNLAPFLASDSADTTITTVNNGLLVMGSSSLNDVSATSLSVGTTLKIDGTSINSLGTTLAIEPLKQADIEFMGGEVSIKTDGTLTVNENATFNKDVVVKGTLSAEHVTVDQHKVTDLSDTESVASSSAGVVTLTAGQTMKKVDTPFVHKNSLVLLTPENSTHGQTPYVTDKKDGESFVIKIDDPITTDITLDFLIVGDK